MGSIQENISSWQLLMLITGETDKFSET